MFNSEHRFQLTLGVELTNDKKLLNRVYTEDRKEHPDIRMYSRLQGRTAALGFESGPWLLVIGDVGF